MRNAIWVISLLLVAACSTHQPPVQMMAEARAAIQAAHDLGSLDSNNVEKLKQAEASLKQASSALNRHHYDQARSAAQSARDLARQVIHATQQAAGARR